MPSKKPAVKARKRLHFSLKQPVRLPASPAERAATPAPAVKPPKKPGFTSTPADARRRAKVPLSPALRAMSKGEIAQYYLDVIKKMTREQEEAGRAVETQRVRTAEAEAKADVERKRAAVKELTARALRLDKAAGGIAQALAEAFESLPKKDPTVCQSLHKALGAFMDGAVWLRERVTASEAEIAAIESGKGDGTLAIRVQGVPYPIVFGDWAHDRLYPQTPGERTYKKSVPVTGLAGTGPVTVSAHVKEDDPSRVMVYVQRQHSMEA